MRKIWIQLLPLLRNKYVLSFLAFFVWIALFDTCSLSDRAVKMQALRALEAEKLYYEQKINEDRHKLELLQSSPANLEEFAREEFLMCTGGRRCVVQPGVGCLCARIQR